VQTRPDCDSKRSHRPPYRPDASFVHQLEPREATLVFDLETNAVNIVPTRANMTVQNLHMLLDARTDSGSCGVNPWGFKSPLSHF
jgi:hypothetical protein